MVSRLRLFTYHFQGQILFLLSTWALSDFNGVGWWFPHYLTCVSNFEQLLCRFLEQIKQNLTSESPVQYLADEKLPGNSIKSLKNIPPRMFKQSGTVKTLFKCNKMEMQTKTHFWSLKRSSQSSRALPEVRANNDGYRGKPCLFLPLSQTILLQMKEQNKQESKYPQQKITNSSKRKKLSYTSSLFHPAQIHVKSLTVFPSNNAEINTSKNYK